MRLILEMIFIMVRFRCRIREWFQSLLYKSLVYSHRSLFLRTFLRLGGHQTQRSVMENPPLSRHSNRSGCLFPVAKGQPVTWDFPQPRHCYRRQALGLCHWLRLPELLSLSEWQCLSASMTAQISVAWCTSKALIYWFIYFNHKCKTFIGHES